MYKQKKILIIYTGGTIGMQTTDHGLSPQKERFHRQLEEIPELYAGEMPLWDMVDMDPLLDSSNIAVREWNEIGQMIARLVREGEDAVPAVKEEVIELCRRFPLYPEL